MISHKGNPGVVRRTSAYDTYFQRQIVCVAEAVPMRDRVIVCEIYTITYILEGTHYILEATHNIYHEADIQWVSFNRKKPTQKQRQNNNRKYRTTWKRKERKDNARKTKTLTFNSVVVEARGETKGFGLI